jgi:uncharacterized protein
LECRDVVGSIRYAKSHKNLAAMTTGLYSRCMGGNSTIIAMAKWPDEFTHVQALVLLNVVSGKTFIERGAENLRLDPEKAARDWTSASVSSPGSGSTRKLRCRTPSTSRCPR